MNALFCYDGPLIKEKGEYFSPVLTNQMFSRYFMVADQLTVAIRTRAMTDAEKKKNINKLETGDIEVLECPNISSAQGMLFDNNAARSILTKAIKEHDLLFIRIPSFLGSMAIDIANEMNKPYLAEVVGCPWDSFWNHSIKGKMIAVPYTIRMKKQLKNSDFVVYVTNHFLQDRYPTKGMNTACSNVELKKSSPEILNKRIEKIKNRSGDFVIGTAAGVDVRYKGQQYIIEALGTLKKQGITNFRYQLAGEGNQDYLRGVAKKFDVENQVEFLGNLSRDEVYDWLDSIDLYAQPSRQEGLPRALIEAMSRGLTCFGAKTGGIPELMEDKYIFSNTASNIKEICTILKSISKDEMLVQAERNFEEAKIYDREGIMQRRRKIFNAYAAEAERYNEKQSK